jgi:LmbE family N-acetylglucosaminyl deacetylase
VTERAPLPELPERLEPGPVLVFAPHADDDVIGCGGAAALHAAAGDPVRVVVAYDGVAGDAQREHEPTSYAERRRREALAGGRHLGLSDYAFWSYAEGHQPPPDLFRAAALRVAGEVRELRPRTVYAPWVGEQHIETAAPGATRSGRRWSRRASST